MADWFGSRSPRWLFDLLDEQDRVIKRLDGVTGGSAKVVAQSRLGGSGSIDLDERGQGVDFMKHRCRVSYDPGNGFEPWAIGTYLFTVPTAKHTDGPTSYSVDLLTKLSIIDEDAVEATYSLDAGTPIVSTVVSLIQSTGETSIAVTPSSATLTNPQVWDAGTSKLTVINDLLAAAGYWSLWCDGNGTFQITPYVSPADRPIAFTFAEGQTSIHKPDWEREQNLSSVPNKSIVIGQGSDDAPPLVGIALNEDPNSPFSYQSRVRWITRTEEGFEGDSQAVFNQRAQRNLLDAMTPVARLSAVHAIVPLNPDDLVQFTTKNHSTKATVQSMEFDFTFDSQCKAEWREVA